MRRARRLRTAPITIAWVAAAFLAAGAPAEIYRWTDESGRLHFTERLDNVPLRHRLEAERSATPSVVPDTPEPVAGELHLGEPAAPAPTLRARGAGGRSEIVIPFVRQGTLMRVDALLNGTVTAPFLVDTGASGISIPSEVADRLGLRVRSDTPHAQIMTANGLVSRALVTLESVQVEGARVEGLQATINPSMNVGLLGGSFFNNFVYRVDAAAGVIALTPTEHMRGGMSEAVWRKRFRSLIDPLVELNDYLARDVMRRRSELALLERRRTELEQALEELETEANRLDVPHAWRN